jgi:branched-chain amino acid transport system ATP-binding protein
VLRVSGIDVYYGEIQALRQVSFEVPRGEVVALLGGNGAGKSTTLKTVAGILSPRSGTIDFEGERIDGLSPEAIVRRGISLVPEGRQLFPEMTVAENLEMGAYIRADRRAFREETDRVFRYFPILRERQRQIAATLSGGEQQMLAIARGLMSRPKLLLLDEPSLGLAPLVLQEIFRILQAINREGTTALLVEQNARMALMLSKYGYVLETGRIAFSGPSGPLLEDEQVRRVYLGL